MSLHAFLSVNANQQSPVKVTDRLELGTSIVDVGHGHVLPFAIHVHGTPAERAEWLRQASVVLGNAALAVEADELEVEAS